jgi:hypothetical protein
MVVKKRIPRAEFHGIFLNFAECGMSPSLIKRTFQTQTNAIIAGFIRVFNAFFKRF